MLLAQLVAGSNPSFDPKGENSSVGRAIVYTPRKRMISDKMCNSKF